MTQWNRRSNLLAVVALAATLLPLSAPATAQGRMNRGQGMGRGLAGAAAATQPLTAAELKWLQFMREEEKMAHDMYLALSEKWNLAIFRNIAVAEQRHVLRLEMLLTRYGVTAPAPSNTPGAYNDPTLSTLYSELLAKGSISSDDALAVGVTLEKKGIADFETALAATAKLDVKQVYSNLMSASYRHLDAFQNGCRMVAAK